MSINQNRVNGWRSVGDSDIMLRTYTSGRSQKRFAPLKLEFSSYSNVSRRKRGKKGNDMKRLLIPFLSSPFSKRSLLVPFLTKKNLWRYVQNHINLRVADSNPVKWKRKSFLSLSFISSFSLPVKCSCQQDVDDARISAGTLITEADNDT